MVALDVEQLKCEENLPLCGEHVPMLRLARAPSLRVQEPKCEVDSPPHSAKVGNKQTLPLLFHMLL